MTALLIAIVVIASIPSGFFSKKIHEKKGYEGGFWIGFLFGIIGLIYSAGLPDLSNKKDATQENEFVSCEESCFPTDDECTEEQEIKLGVNDIDIDGNHFIYCEKCGFPIYNDEVECNNCGNKVKKA